MKFLRIVLIFSLYLTICVNNQGWASPKIVYSLILAGDGGIVDSNVLNALVKATYSNPRNTSVYLLGDNIYPAGLPDLNDPTYEQSKSRLLKQITAFKLPVGKLILMPGNHDWSESGPGGLRAVINQEKFIREVLGEGSFYPVNGCPGPIVVEERNDLVVIVLNSQWWLHEFERPDSSQSGCEFFNEETILSGIRKILVSNLSQKSVVFLQHHPLESVGSHGLGNSCNQDFACERYQNMRNKILSVLDTHKPLICASGHDHSLQHITGSYGCSNFIVSGSLSYRSGVSPDANTRFASSNFGFFRLDFFSDSKVRLQAVEVDDRNTLGRISYQVYLR